MVNTRWITAAGYPAYTVYNDCKSNPFRKEGFYCGYVEVPKGHPLFGLSYKDNMPRSDDPINEAIIIYGGVTWGGPSLLGDAKEWSFGFHCAGPRDTIETCDLGFVTRECESLAEQLKELEGRPNDDTPEV